MPVLGRDPSKIRTGITKTMNSNTDLLAQIYLFFNIFKNKITSLGGGFIPAHRTADLNRLAGYHSGNIFAPEVAVFIHKPSHNLSVGINIRSRNILVRTNMLRGLPDIFPT